MNAIRRVLRDHLRERPFDFFVALILFFVGFTVIIDDHWPEKNVDNPIVQIIVIIISIYLMVASIMIMSSLSCNRKKRPVLSLMGEMYGWMMVSFASIAIILTYLGSMIGGVPQSWWGFSVMMFIWCGMFISSGVRYLDLLQVYRSLKK